jgi:hypothetical protein
VWSAVTMVVTPILERQPPVLNKVDKFDPVSTRMGR